MNIWYGTLIIIIFLSMIQLFCYTSLYIKIYHFFQKYAAECLSKPTRLFEKIPTGMTLPDGTCNWYKRIYGIIKRDENRVRTSKASCQISI